MTTSYFFYVGKIKCNSCSGKLEGKIRSWLKEETSIKLNLFNVDVTEPDPKRTTLLIEDDGSDQKELWYKIKNKIEEFGYSCESYEYPDTAEPISDKNQVRSESLKDQTIGILKKTLDYAQGVFLSHWFLGSLGCAVGIALLIASLASGGLPLAAMIPLAVLSIVLTFILGARSYYDAVEKLVKTKSLTMDTLFSISTLSGIVVSLAAFYYPWLPMMFEAGLLIYGFRHIGIAVEETIKEKINSAKFQDKAPLFVSLYIENHLTQVKLNRIKPGDLIRINPGDTIAFDGECMQKTSVYTTMFDGSILPTEVNSGSKILAGTKLSEDAEPLMFRVVKTAKDSNLSQLDEGIARALLEKAPLELTTTQILTYFIPAVIMFSIVAGIVIGMFFPPAVAIQFVLTMLVSACPCTLGLIIPLAVKTGMHKAAEHGVHFKNATALQSAEQIDTVVFDLNGTLTKGIYSVLRHKVLDNTGVTQDDFFKICSALEKNSSHPIGSAIYSFAQTKCKDTWDVEGLDKSHHSGRGGLINNTNYFIGSKTLMQDKGISVDSFEKQIDLVAGESLVFVANEKQVIGYMIICDSLRDDAKSTVNALIAMGKDVHLCTGADENTANCYAKELGIKTVYANCCATSKLGDRSKPAYLKSLKAKGKKIAMVGDAPNDATALIDSDLGIAIVSNNSDLATQKNAGAIIRTGKLLPIVSTFTVSSQTVSNIKQNLILSLSYNLGVVLVGGLCVVAGFTLHPGVGVALMALQACIILLNVYRFKCQVLPYVQEESIGKEEALNTSHQKMNKLRPNNSVEYSSENKDDFGINYTKVFKDIDSKVETQFSEVLQIKN